MSKIRIEIIGNIASGRSTLLELLRNEGYNVISENFEAHPFLKSFYENSTEFAFETEMCFLLQHYYDYKISSLEGINICDFSIYLDDAFARVTLDSDDYRLFKELKNHISHKYGLPDLVIYTSCSPETSYNRIMMRNREMEKGIELDYLKLIDNEIREVCSTINNLFIVNTDLVSLVDESDSKNIIEQIKKVLKCCRNLGDWEN